MIELFNKLSALINLVIFILVAVGVYWRLKIEITELQINQKNMQIDQNNMQKDREKKWEDYDEDKKKFFTIYDNLNQCLSNVSGDIKEIKTNILWLKNQK